jgi:glycogen(starch) synthase
MALHGSLLELKGQGDTILGQLLRTADWITACSSAVLEDAREVAPNICGKSSVLYYGLSDPGVNPEPLSFDPPHILAIGRLVRDKGFDVVIRAFVSVLERHPDARLMITGDGPARAGLESEVEELRLGSSVEFTGEIPPAEVYGLMNRASMVVVPSRYREAFGLVALEGSQMARPVIASRVGGLQEVVQHDETGLLVEMENPEDLADAVVHLIEHPDKARRLGLQGRLRAREKFSWSGYIDNYQKICKKIT